MAAYTTDAIVKKQLVALQPATSYGSVDFATVIARAQNKIDSILGVRFAVPFTTAPPLVADLAAELAAFLVFRMIQANNKSLGQNAAMWQQNCDETLKMLEDIANYKIRLVDSSGNDVASRSNMLRSSSKDVQPVFDVDDAECWKIPTSTLESIEDAREAG